MKRTLALLIALFPFGCMNAGTLELGSDVPSVEVADQSAEVVKLSQAGADGWTLVYFYPKADTPGCTKQACSLRDSYEQLTERGVQVYGVSRDSVADQKAFAEKYKLPFSLLADTEGTLMEAFGVPALAGKTLPTRQAFLFKEGKLVWKDEAASTDEQAADILKVLNEGSLN